MPTARTITGVGVTLAALAVGLPWDASVARVEGQSGTPIQVNASADRHPIDPRIYGVSWGSTAELAALNAPLNRWGGNSTTRYNWQLNADNRGSDWYFESIGYASATAGAEADGFVADSFAGSAQPMLTVPIIGWVAKLGSNRAKLASFSAARYGAQQDCDWSWFPDACNGILTNGQPVTGNDKNDASLPSTPAIQKAWAQHLVSRWGGAGQGGLRYYIYDNEPSIWHGTHRDVHPTGVRMSELRDAVIAYGTAIREADPGAVLAGPEEWGWMGYFWSGYDQQYMADTGCWSCWPDRQANGGMAFMPWLLDQLRRHEVATGARLLHVFTLHYYPQGGEYGGGTSTDMQLRRNRSTRSLWDPSYVDETWIGDVVRLIPRMREWVDAYYPGTEIGITEYNWGAEAHINGATTQADLLGIFGREGLDLATRWTVPPSDSPTFKAMQIYRNYDGNRSTFGDISVRATVPDPDSVAAFAAERSSDGALTIVAINKVTSSALVNLSLTAFSAGPAAQVFRLGASNTITRQADVAVTNGAIATTLPAQTISLFVVPRATLPTLSIGDAATSEGGSGTNVAVFTLTLSAASSQPVTVGYATANGTASADSDYLATSGTATFSPGQTSKTIAVTVNGDLVDEPDESFSVTLSNPANAVLADATGQGTILDDDPTPQLLIEDCAALEGAAGATTACPFHLALSGPSSSTVSLSYATANGTALAGSDYDAGSGTVTFAPLSIGPQTVSVSVRGDANVEPDESFFLNLSGASGATLPDAQGAGTILDDDAPSLSTSELSHGSRQRGMLAAQTGPDFYRLAQLPYSSYEVVLDATSGEIGSGLLLARVAADNVTVLQSAPPSGVGSSRSLRFRNTLPQTVAGQHVRVSAGGGGACSSGCGYEIRAYETTETCARFNNSGTQSSVLMIQNPAQASVSASAYFWTTAGRLLHVQALTLSPRSLTLLSTTSIPALLGTSGSVVIASDAAYGVLRGKVVAVEPATGFSFDSVLEPRVRP